MAKDLLSEIEMQEHISIQQHIQAPMLKFLMGLMYHL